MNPEIFSDVVLLWLGPVPLTRTMVSSAGICLVLTVLATLIARQIQRAPGSRTALVGRMLFGFTRGLVTEAAGKSSPTLEIFAGTLFWFIAAAAVIGQLPGIPSPTADLAASSGLATLVFFAVPIAGIQAQGVGPYLKHYFRPNPLLFPLHVVSELSRTLALALRLFGNMMSGHLIVGLLVAIAGFLVPVPLMALDLLIGLLQAYIFTILASVYIGAAIVVTEQA